MTLQNKSCLPEWIYSKHWDPQNCASDCYECPAQHPSTGGTASPHVILSPLGSAEMKFGLLGKIVCGRTLFFWKTFSRVSRQYRVAVSSDVFQSHLLRKALVGEESGFQSVLKICPCCSEFWWEYFWLLVRWGLVCLFWGFVCFRFLGFFVFTQGVCAKQFLQSWSVDSLARHAEHWLHKKSRKISVLALPPTFPSSLYPTLGWSFIFSLLPLYKMSFLPSLCDWSHTSASCISKFVGWGSSTAAPPLEV